MINVPQNSVSDFPPDPPGYQDRQKPKEQLVKEMLAAIEEDRRIGMLWGLPEKIIKKQQQWRRERYRRIIAGE